MSFFDMIVKGTDQEGTIVCQLHHDQGYCFLHDSFLHSVLCLPLYQHEFCSCIQVRCGCFMTSTVFKVLPLSHTFSKVDMLGKGVFVPFSEPANIYLLKLLSMYRWADRQKLIAPVYAEMCLKEVPVCTVYRFYMQWLNYLLLLRAPF